MTFAYRLRKPAGNAKTRRDGPPALLVCDLGRSEAAELALTIASELSGAARRDVTLLSDLAVVAGPEAAALELAAIDRTPVYEVFVAVEHGQPMRLSTRLISAVVALRISSVKRIGARGRNGPYVRPPIEGARRALFVFPGIFAPPRTGSHQRAFSTVLDLIDDGYDVDIVLKRSGSRLLERVRPYFDLASPHVVSYEIGATAPEPPQEPERQPDPAGRALGLLRSLRDRFAPSGSSEDRDPEPFMFEREAEDIDDAAKAMVAGMIAEANYRLIVVTFPWMVSLLPDPPPEGVRIVCDTHDVITNRRRELAEEGDPLGDEARSLAAERAALAKCDAVLAISRSDARMFEQTMGLPNVVTHPLTFHTADEAVEWRSAARPMVFGFLGSDMPANRRALRFIMVHWWPVIERFSPDSRLVIAGAISNAPGVSPYVILRGNISLLGFVEDLAGFFASIDVLLAPTIVQAGVNVKNVEALLRRRPVITNVLGAKSLEPLVIPTRCETDDGFLNIIRKLDRNDPGLMAELETLFEQAAAYHSKPVRLSWA